MFVGQLIEWTWLERHLMHSMYMYLRSRFGNFRVEPSSSWSYSYPNAFARQKPYLRKVQGRPSKPHRAKLSCHEFPERDSSLHFKRIVETRYKGSGMRIFNLQADSLENVICLSRSSKSRRDCHSYPRSGAECQMRGTNSFRMPLLGSNESNATDKGS